MAIIIIDLPTRKFWDVSGWTLRQLLEDIKQSNVCSADLHSMMENTELYKSADLSDLPEDLARDFVLKAQSVATDVLHGNLKSGLEEKSYANQKTREQYRETLRMLLALLDSSRFANTQKEI